MKRRYDYNHNNKIIVEILRFLFFTTKLMHLKQKYLSYKQIIVI